MRAARSGRYFDSSGDSEGLLLTETAGTWATGVQASLPANAAANPDAFVGSVSCASAGDCSAVGGYTDSSGDSEGLLWTGSSGVWATGVQASLPANAGSQPFPDLNSVSCASAGNCAVAGDYDDSSGHSQGLLLGESSGTWATGVQAPLPADAAADPGALVSLGVMRVGR